MEQNIKDLVIPEMIKVMKKYDSNACELVLNGLKKKFNLSKEEADECEKIATKKLYIEEHGINEWNNHVKSIKDNLNIDIDVPLDEGFDFYTEYFINLDEGAKTEYLKYVAGHINNVKKGYRWLKKNLPEIFMNQSKFKTSMTIAKHDLSKFNYKKEFKPYSDHFKGTPEQREAGRDAFKQAWNHHQKVNKHHWQYWVLVNSSGQIEVLDMPFENIVEMICDWWSFSWKTNDLYNIFDWYNKNKNKMILSPKTRSTTEMILHKLKNKLDEMKKSGKLDESLEFGQDLLAQYYIYEEDELNDEPKDLNEEYFQKSTNLGNYEIKENQNSFKLVLDKKIISNLNYNIYENNKWKLILLSDVETDKQYRHKGYATILLKHALRSLQDNYKDFTIYLVVKPDNTNAINLYKKFNFKIHGILNEDNTDYYVMSLTDKYMDKLKESWGKRFKESLTEKINWDTVLTKPLQLNKEINLYHFSMFKDPKGMVYPLYKSVGNKLGGREYVSWWSEQPDESMLHLMQWSRRNVPGIEKNVNFMQRWKPDDGRGYKRSVGVFLDTFYNDHKDDFNNMRIYRYDIKRKIKDLHRGQEYALHEWTIEGEVKADKVVTLTFKDCLKNGSAEIVDQKTFDNYLKNYSFRYIADIQKKPWIYFDYDIVKQKTKERQPEEWRNKPWNQEKMLVLGNPKYKDIIAAGLTESTDITKINNIMSSIKYQAYDKNSNKVSDSEMGNAVIQSIKHTLQTKSGTCAEQALLEKYLFDKYNIPADVYFIEYTEDKEKNAYPSHCFVVYQDNNKYYWYEHAWEKYRGIHEYNSLKELFNDISNKFCDKKYQNTLTITNANDFQPGMNEDDICDNQVNKKLENKSGIYSLTESKMLLPKESIISDAGYTMHQVNFYKGTTKIGYLAYNDNYIEAIYIDPKYRGKGYANDIMKYAIEKGLTNLEVKQNNDIAINLYKKFNYKIDKEDTFNGPEGETKVYKMSLSEEYNILQEKYIPLFEKIDLASVSQPNKIKTIDNDLMSIFKNYDFGFIHNGKKYLYKDLGEKNFWDAFYKLYSFDDFNDNKKYKTAVCFASTNLVSKYLDSKNIKNDKWLSVFPDGTKPHAFNGFNYKQYYIKADFTPKNYKIKVYNNEEEFKDEKIKEGKIMIKYTNEDLINTNVENFINNMINKNTLTESLLNKETLELNLEKWVPGSILYITGNSGSGKSTLARKILSERSDTELFELDTFFVIKFNSKEDAINIIENDESFNNEYLFNKSANVKKLFLDFVKSIPEKDFLSSEKIRREYSLAFIREAEKRLKNTNKKYIFEGTNIFKDEDPEFYQDKPLIIVGTGYIVSTIRAIKRVFNKDNLTIKEKWKILSDRIFNNKTKYERSKELDNFRYAITLKEEKIIYKNISELANGTVLLMRSGYNSIKIDDILLNISKIKGETKPYIHYVDIEDYDEDLNSKQNNGYDIMAYREPKSDEASALIEIVEKNKNKWDWQREDTLTESYNNLDESLLSHDNIELNIDKWKDGSILYITGLSGSGKTTLAKQLAKEYNCDYAELDIIFMTLKRTKEKSLNNINKNYSGLLNTLITKFINNIPDNQFAICDTIYDITDIQMKNILQKCEEFAIYLEKEYKKTNKRLILEGTQCTKFSNNFFNNRPLIIVGTGFIKSQFRGIIRTIHGNGSNQAKLKNIFKRINSESLKNDNLMLDKFKEKILFKNLQECCNNNPFAALQQKMDNHFLNESTYTTKAQKQYSDYLITHVSNTKKGYFFIKDNCPEMLEGADIKQIEDNIIVHDESKYSNEEYNAYSNFFYGERTPEVKKAFQLAWEHHWTHNPHHPEYWHGADMPLEYIIEMICDWWSFSWKDNDLSTIFDFWEKAKVDKHKKLSENTKQTVQRLLNILKDTLVRMDLIDDWIIE